MVVALEDSSMGALVGHLATMVIIYIYIYIYISQWWLSIYIGASVVACYVSHNGGCLGRCHHWHMYIYNILESRWRFNI